jgi:hypothetical protein
VQLFFFWVTFQLSYVIVDPAEFWHLTQTVSVYPATMSCFASILPVDDVI